MSMSAGSTALRWSKEDIVEYYRANEAAYRVWGPNMHYGYWEPGVRTQRQASLRFNEVVAQTADISRDDHVLDAGCGVGGCSIYLARAFGCRVTGITITPQQVELARRNAARAGVSDLTDFHEMDYEHTTLSSGRFSVVWGLESICYAEDKRRFVAEAFRLLGDGGRLVVADGFASREHYEGDDARLMQRWLDGWVVNSLKTPQRWRRFAEEAGFGSSTYRNVTPYVRKTSRLMLIASLPFLPLHLLDRVFRLKPYPTDALFNQYFAMKRGLWEYGIFLARK